MQERTAKESEGREIIDFNAIHKTYSDAHTHTHKHACDVTQIYTVLHTYIHTYTPVIDIDISTLWTCDQSLVPRM